MADVSSKLDQLKDWLRQKRPDLDQIEHNLDLIETGTVNSLSFVEYVLTIEDLSGREIEMNDGLLEKVRTLERVAENFFR